MRRMKLRVDRYGIHLTWGTPPPVVITIQATAYIDGEAAAQAVYSHLVEKARKHNG
jgi:hypothetical protein